MKDARMDDLIRKELSAVLREARGQSCPDENLMAAYLEASLSPGETAQLESHLSSCAACQEVLALALKLQAPDAPAARPARAVSWRRLFRLAIPIPALGAGLAAAFVIALFFTWDRWFDDSSPELQKDQAIATLRSPQTPAPAGEAVQVRKDEVTVRGEPLSAGTGGRGKTERGPAPATKTKEMDFGTGERASLMGREQPLREQIQAETKAGSIAGEEMAAHDLEPADLQVESQRGDSGNVPPPQARAGMPAGAAASRAELSVPAAPRPNDRSLAGGFSALNMAPMAQTLVPDEKAFVELKRGVSKEIGGKTFYRRPDGIWIDGDCVEHRGAPLIEVLPAVPEYREILARYPGLDDLVPVVIHWNESNYFLR